MYERDWLLRMIREVAQVLGGISRLRDNGQLPEARRLADESLRHLLGFGITEAESLSGDSLIELVRLTRGSEDKNQLFGDQVAALAFILQGIGSIHEASGDTDQSISMYLKSLQAHLTAAVEAGVNSPQVADAIEGLVELLHEYVLPVPIKRLLWQWTENEGIYDQAENWLFELLESEPRDQALIKQGVEFYRRLLDRNDDELERGGLPRDEVESGLTEMKRLRK